MIIKYPLSPVDVVMLCVDIVTAVMAGGSEEDNNNLYNVKNVHLLYGLCTIKF